MYIHRILFIKILNSPVFLQAQPPRGFFASLFGGNRRQEEQQRLRERLQEQLQELQSRIVELEGDLEEKKREKTEHQRKWDRLESEYQHKCHIAHTTQQSLAKVEEDLKTSNEKVGLMNQRIKELEDDRADKKREAIEAEVHHAFIIGV